MCVSLREHIFWHWSVASYLRINPATKFGFFYFRYYTISKMLGLSRGAVPSLVVYIGSCIEQRCPRVTKIAGPLVLLQTLAWERIHVSRPERLMPWRGQRGVGAGLPPDPMARPLEAPKVRLWIRSTDICSLIHKCQCFATMS